MSTRPYVRLSVHKKFGQEQEGILPELLSSSGIV